MSIIIKETAIRAALNTILDPCSEVAGAPAGLDDMGLIEAIKIQPRESGKADVKVDLCVTHPTCIMAGMFVHSAQEKLQALEGVESCDVQLKSTVWTPQRMRPTYAKQLERTRQAQS